MALAYWRQGVAGGGVEEGNAALLGLVADGVGGILLAGLEFLLDLFGAAKYSSPWKAAGTALSRSSTS